MSGSIQILPSCFNAVFYDFSKMLNSTVPDLMGRYLPQELSLFGYCVLLMHETIFEVTMATLTSSNKMP